MTVQGLYQQCKGEGTNEVADKVAYITCIAYVSGVGDTLQAQGASGAKIFSICAKPSYGAMVQAFVN
jgi:hypothetical protein